MEYMAVDKDLVLRNVRSNQMDKVLNEAIREEITADQLALVAKTYPEFSTEAKNARVRADEATGRYKAFLAHSGIKESDLTEARSRIVRDSLVGLEGQHIEFSEKLNNPDFYGLAQADVEQGKKQLAVLEAGLTVVKEKL